MTDDSTDFCLTAASVVMLLPKFGHLGPTHISIWNNGSEFGNDIILSIINSLPPLWMSTCRRYEINGIPTTRLRTFRLRHFVYRHFVYRHFVYYGFLC